MAQERVAREQRERAAEVLAREREHVAEVLARERERAAEVLARERERAAEELARERERAAEELARERERAAELLARERERAAAELARERAALERERVARELVNQQRERVAQEQERVAREQRERAAQEPVLEPEQRRSAARERRRLAVLELERERAAQERRRRSARERYRAAQERRRAAQEQRERAAETEAPAQERPIPPLPVRPEEGTAASLPTESDVPVPAPSTVYAAGTNQLRPVAVLSDAEKAELWRGAQVVVRRAMSEPYQDREGLNIRFTTWVAGSRFSGERYEALENLVRTELPRYLGEALDELYPERDFPHRVSEWPVTYGHLPGNKANSGKWELAVLDGPRETVASYRAKDTLQAWLFLDRLQEVDRRRIEWMAEGFADAVVRAPANELLRFEAVLHVMSFPGGHADANQKRLAPLVQLIEAAVWRRVGEEPERAEQVLARVRVALEESTGNPRHGLVEVTIGGRRPEAGPVDAAGVGAVREVQVRRDREAGGTAQDRAREVQVRRDREAGGTAQDRAREEARRERELAEARRGKRRRVEEVEEEVRPAPQPPVSRPRPPVPAPQAPVSRPRPPVSGSGLPVSVPQAPVSRPEPPVSGSGLPVSVPQAPVSRPEPPVSGSGLPVSVPQAPVSRPEPPVIAPQQPVSRPDMPVVRPGVPVIPPEPGALAWGNHVDRFARRLSREDRAEVLRVAPDIVRQAMAGDYQKYEGLDLRVKVKLSRTRWADDLFSALRTSFERDLPEILNATLDELYPAEEYPNRPSHWLVTVTQEQGDKTSNGNWSLVIGDGPRETVASYRARRAYETRFAVGEFSAVDRARIAWMAEGFADALVHALAQPQRGQRLPQFSGLVHAVHTPGIATERGLSPLWQLVEAAVRWRLGQYPAGAFPMPPQEMLALALAQVGLRPVMHPPGEPMVGVVQIGVEGQRPEVGLFGPEVYTDPENPLP
ncbi:hypothetical protein GKO32_36960 [Amycolatopsis sp. RM579]|uniref:Uncharacterized protein n=1 Tax=Amycolatopsis pithecellobii TaxID=664692 RepID=A0A6N7ZCW2_9PSEU|nr:hypothetical protein [Amycolatopsis pithecellobii]